MENPERKYQISRGQISGVCNGKFGYVIPLVKAGLPESFKKAIVNDKTNHARMRVLENGALVSGEAVRLSDGRFQMLEISPLPPPARRIS